MVTFLAYIYIYIVYIKHIHIPGLNFYFDHHLVLMGVISSAGLLLVKCKWEGLGLGFSESVHRVFSFIHSLFVPEIHIW
jgi:hypothetical protein